MVRIPRWMRDHGLLDAGDSLFERVAVIVVVLIALAVIFVILQAIFFSDAALLTGP